MSDAPSPYGESVESGPVESGQAEAPPEQSEAPSSEPEYDYFDVDDDTAQRYVRVKVDGEEVPVTLGEALQGYQRTAAYTRRSQELAEQRRQQEDAVRLHQAMQVNPGLTVQILANHAGMSIDQFLGLSPAQQQAAIDAEEVDYDDPLEREIVQERRAREALEQRLNARDADEYLARQVYGLQQQYGLNDDQVRAVVGTAMQMNLGIEYLPMVFQSMMFQAQQAAYADQQSQREADEQRRQQAAQNAAAIVGNGAGVASSGLTNTAANAGYSTYREAIEAAYDEIERKQR